MNTLVEDLQDSFLKTELVGAPMSTNCSSPRSWDLAKRLASAATCRSTSAAPPSSRGYGMLKGDPCGPDGVLWGHRQEDRACRRPFARLQGHAPPTNIAVAIPCHHAVRDDGSLSGDA